MKGNSNLKGGSAFEASILIYLCFINCTVLFVLIFIFRDASSSLLADTVEKLTNAEALYRQQNAL